MKVTIDGIEYDSEKPINIVLAAMQLGIEIPHYCYHPALSVVASCRMCLVEMGMPDKQSGELKMLPKLIPACQTPIAEGMVVDTCSEKVKANQKAVMEYLLINHPLDCPVCDQAGECYLQDYSFRFGNPLSRFEEVKEKQPKKRVGENVLLYADRCVMCSRCVRFSREVSGGGELAVTHRGNKAEIDIYPGHPLDDNMSTNVADICPVGALLDTQFLFKQRVWFLKGADSLCPGCSTGCSIRVDHNENKVWRLVPRENQAVNGFWMCDEGRHGWGYLHSEQRLRDPMVRRGHDLDHASWAEAIEHVQYRLELAAAENGPGSIAALLSPMATNEENFLVATYARSLDGTAMLACGPVPQEGADKEFKSGFTVRAEKAPNRAGVLALQGHFAGTSGDCDALIEKIEQGTIKAVYILGGYSAEWADGKLIAALKKCDLVVVQDILAHKAASVADVVLPSAAFAENEGSYTNAQGYNQAFEWAIPPVESARRGGQILMEVSGMRGLYNSATIREQFATQIPSLVITDLPKPLYVMPTISAQPRVDLITRHEAVAP